MFFMFQYSTAQDQKLFAGVRFQKSIDLYIENGISFHYSHPGLLKGKLLPGFSYLSSRLGSAMGSNAIKQDNFLISGTYSFRNDKLIQPLFTLNTGYFIADYEADVFKSIPNSSLIISFEGGLAANVSEPFRVSTSFGYNFVSGDGISSPGTLFPFFYQLSLSYNILNVIK
jgi:hypothetical protein